MADRMVRVDQLLREELARLIQEDAEELGIVDIVDLQTSRDLSQAKVFVTAHGSHDPVALGKQLAARASGYAGRLGRRLKLKRIPHFAFVLDTSGEEINRVESLFDALQAGRPKGS